MPGADLLARLRPPRPADDAELPVPVAVDPAGELARAVRLPEPDDGGRGIGYAVVDASRTVRYSTFDPSWLANAFEVATIATSVERKAATSARFGTAGALLEAERQDLR